MASLIQSLSAEPPQPLPPPFQPPVTRRWRVTLAGGKTISVVEAKSFRVEGGALVLVQPAGCAAAYAPGTWLTIEAHDTEG